MRSPSDDLVPDIITQKELLIKYQDQIPTSQFPNTEMELGSGDGLMQFGLISNFIYQNCGQGVHNYKVFRVVVLEA